MLIDQIIAPAKPLEEAKLTLILMLSGSSYEMKIFVCGLNTHGVWDTGSHCLTHGEFAVVGLLRTP